MRKELIPTIDLMEIVVENSVKDEGGTTVSGFTDVCRAVAKLQVMPNEKVVAYLKQRLNALRRSGHAIPIFSDVNVKRGRTKAATANNAILETLLLNKGYSRSEVSRMMDASLLATAEKKKKRKTKRSMRRRPDGQSDLTDL